MSIEENKAIVQRAAEEVMSKKNLAVVDELFAADYVSHAAGGQEVRGPEGVKQFLSMYDSAFPDMRETIEDMVAEGDKVVARVTMTGTHQGEFMGMAATGKQVTVTGIAILRIVGGKVVEEWREDDRLGVMQQLGVIPTQ